MKRQMAATAELLTSAGEPGGSLADTAYRMLERKIILLELVPGSMLSELALSKQLGIGRTPIREAIKQLEREGLVTVIPRRGLMVTELNISHYLKLLEVRRELEALVARAAAQRASPDQRQRMRAVADAIEEAAARDDLGWFMTESWQYHGLPLEAAGNECLATAMGLFRGQSQRFWYAHFERHANLPEAARVHGARLRAIAAGDPDQAERAAGAVMDMLERFARATLEFNAGRRQP